MTSLLDDQDRPLGDGNLGLFGPDSVAWRLHADPAVLIGGIRALLEQSLHPLVMAGVVQHTAYRDHLWQRLRDTHLYVLTTVYGTVDEALDAAAAVRSLHNPVHGVDVVTGGHYDAHDPDLLRWVHDTEVDSFLVAYQRFGGRALSAADADRYVHEMARGGELVGIPAADLPRSVAALRGDIAAFRPVLRSTPGSREVARLLAWPPLPLWARPIWGSMYSGAVATIPGDLRRLHPFLPAFRPVDVSLGLPAFLLARLGRMLLPGSPIVRAARQRVGAVAG